MIVEYECPVFLWEKPGFTNHAAAVYCFSWKNADCEAPRYLHVSQHKEQKEEGQSAKITAGKQVVHRHVNGLCIVTAGNVLQLATSTTSADGSDESQQQQGQSLTVSSIKYLVKVAPDAQSADSHIPPGCPLRCDVQGKNHAELPAQSLNTRPPGRAGSAMLKPERFGRRSVPSRGLRLPKG